MKWFLIITIMGIDPNGRGVNPQRYSTELSREDRIWCQRAAQEINDQLARALNDAQALVIAQASCEKM